MSLRFMEGLPVENIAARTGDYSPASVAEKVNAVLKEDSELQDQLDQALNMEGLTIEQIAKETFMSNLEEAQRQAICSLIGTYRATLKGSNGMETKDLIAERANIVKELVEKLTQE